jgi:thermitase
MDSLSRVVRTLAVVSATVVGALVAVPGVAGAVPVAAGGAPVAAGDGPDAATLAAFVATHHSSGSGRFASVRSGGYASSGGFADTACYGTSHTQSGTNGASQLIVTSFGLFYDCNFNAWELDVTTQDAWSESDLEHVAVIADTDLNSSTGCNGYDRAIVGTFDSTQGLVAAALVTPSCDQTTWLVADQDQVTHPTATTVALDFLQDDLNNPGSFRWSGSLQGTAESTADRFPVTGLLTETGYPTVPADNACPPGLLDGLPARMAVLPDASATAAAVDALRRAGLGSVTAEAGGVVRFTGDPPAASAALGAAGIAASVSTDRIAHYADVPNDTSYAQQWNLPLIDMPTAWDVTHGSGSVAVADIDTGVDATHPDLQGKLTPGYDFTTKAALAPGNTDTNGHGTAVAGVIGAATNNALGLAGVGWDTTVTPVKVSNGDSDLTTSAVVAGLDWAVANGNKVINMSLGTCGEPTLASAVQNAEAHGALIVAAAGNQFLAGNPIEYPAGYPGVVGVGALARDGSKAVYSETGPGVALVAPGGSADGNPADDIPVLQAGGGYAAEAGTSFASPEVAAVAALILAADPGVTPADAGAIEVATAVHVGTSPDSNYGNGELDAAKALAVAKKVRRAAGPDRYATAVALSQLGFPNGASTVFVASGDTFADALATGALSGVQSGPILLTGACNLPSGTAAELARLKPKTVYVIGGPLAVCDAVLQTVSQASGVSAVRVSGPDRYATDAAIARLGWASTAPTVYVTTGVNFPDGLTGAARAALDGAPLLLTDTCTLPSSIQQTLARLAPTTVKIIGGTVSICPAVQSAIAAAAPGAQVIRIAGATRVDTGELVAQDGWKTAPSVVVASAATFPDALSAGAFAALNKVPLLINDACKADPGLAQEVTALGATSMTVMGGSLALCGAAVAPLAVALS